MAWLDNRYWAHPKVAQLTPAQRWVSVAAILYSCGFGLYGRLAPAHQRAIGSSSMIRRAIVAAGLWDEDGDDILIHDWDEHNGRRDAKIEERRAADRERKRVKRAAERLAESLAMSVGRPNGSPEDVSADCPQEVRGDVRRKSPRAGARVVTDDGVKEEEHLERDVSGALNATGAKPAHVWQEQDQPPDLTRIMEVPL